MIRGTSVPMVLRIRNDKLLGVDIVKVSYKQGSYRLDKLCVPVPDGNDALIVVPLTVDETLGFKSGTSKVQVTWKKNGMQDKTFIADFHVSDTIDEEEMYSEQ